MTFGKSKRVRKNSEARKKKRDSTWEYCLWLTFAFPPDSFLTASRPQSDTLPARHCHLLGDSLRAPWRCLENLSLSLSHPCLPSPSSQLGAFVDVDSSSLGYHSSCLWQTLGKIKNPAPLISLEGLQIEFSPSQCPLSWLSLGAEAGPWLRPKDQLTEFEMLWSWQAKGGNWRAVGLLVTFQAGITPGIRSPHLHWCWGHWRAAHRASRGRIIDKEIIPSGRCGSDGEAAFGNSANWVL